MALLGMKDKQAAAAVKAKAGTLPNPAHHKSVQEHERKLREVAEQLPILEAAHERAQRELQVTAGILDHVETLHLAGRADGSLVEEARSKRDAAKQAAASAEVAVTQARRQHGLLAAGHALVLNDAKREAARITVNTYAAAMQDFRDKLLVASDAYERVRVMRDEIGGVWPDEMLSTGWPQALGLFFMRWDELRPPYVEGHAGMDTKLGLFLAAYDAWYPQRYDAARQGEPIEVNTSNNPYEERQLAPGVVQSYVTEGSGATVVGPNLEQVMASLGLSIGE